MLHRNERLTRQTLQKQKLAVNQHDWNPASGLSQVKIGVVDEATSPAVT